MNRRFAVLAAATIFVATGSAQQPPQQVPGAIRSKVVLVPVDVRVLDRQGNPITDLAQSDFTVLEDGRPQQIGHFATQAFDALAPGSLPPEPVLRRGPGLEESPITRRTFLIVLGRGRLQYPAKGFDAIREFIRTRALPQDLVALQAWGRVTDFTTDRSSLMRFIDHYEREHQKIEALLDHWFDGPWMFDLEASPGIERKIAAFFEAPGLPPVRRLAAIDLDGETPFERQQRVASQAQTWLHTGRGEPYQDFAYEADGHDDAHKLTAAIDFLRYYEGEKHIVLISEDGLRSVRARSSDVIAARAADARVSVSIVRTGGVDDTNGHPAQLLANADARYIASSTGGIASAYKWASETIGRVDRATRFQYTLGYYPANTAYDGRKRDIKVVVNRPGATVLHRRSYFGREDLVPYDRRAFTTHARLTSAGAYRVQLRDIGVKVDGGISIDRQNAWQVRAKVAIDPSTIAFETVDGRHVASLDVAVFVGSRGQREIGEVKQRVDLKLEPATLARTKAEGFVFETTIDLKKGPPKYLKAVVYDYATDRLGSAAATIK